MADPAAQSPFVSSSSAPSEPTGSACKRHGNPACADPLVSSSQPVSLFAASPASEAASGGGEGKPPLRLSSPEAFVPFSSSSSSSSQGEPQKEKDSPESPFELVLDRAAFDREYAAALLGERAALSQIPEDQICDFTSKPRGVGGGIAKSPALCRQSSGTAAALEEVSKCVREMHSFTSELLSWDWVERGDGPPPGDDSSGDSDDTVIEDDGERGDGTASLPAPQRPGGGSVVPMGAPRVGGGGGESEPGPQRGVSVVPMGSPAREVESEPEPQRGSVVLMKSPAREVESEPEPQRSSVVPMGSPAREVESEPEPQRGSVVPMGSPAREVESEPEPRQGCSVVPLENPTREVESEPEPQRGCSVVPMENPTREVESEPEPQRGSVVPMGSPAREVESEPEPQRGASVVPLENPACNVESEPGTLVVPMKSPARDVESEPEPQRGSVVPMKSPAIDVESPPEPQPRAWVVPMETPPHQEGLGSPQAIRDAPKSVPPKTTPPDMEQVTLRALREAMETPPGPPTPPGTPRLLPPLAVHDLIFWRDVRRSGLVFASSLLLLLSLAAFSVVSVVAYLVLALLSVTISFRVYKSVIQAVQKSEEGHPFRAYLELDVTLSPEAFQSHATAAMAHVNHALRLLLRLFLVEDLVDSLKLAVAMWLMTYVGAVFNGITLLILAELLAFTLPPVYEKNKVQIDHYVGIARQQTKSLIAKVQAKLPGLAKKKPE